MTDSRSARGQGRKALGARGEQQAVQLLEAAGMAVLDRNWSCSHGEIDIVALDRDVLVIVEVKTRRSNRFGSPVEAVVPAKVDRLRRLTWAWVDAHRDELPRFRQPRIDVVAIWCPPGGPERVEHLVGVS